MSWYYIKEQQTIGPVTDEEIFSLISKNEICTFDLLSQNESPWQFAYKYKCFYNYFNTQELVQDDKKDWVVMTFKVNGSRKQLGPWTEKDVREAIYAGLIKYTDLIWRKDMIQWYPITLLEMFNPKVKFEYYKLENKKEMFSDKKVKPYMIYVPNLPRVELPPIDADGESLV